MRLPYSGVFFARQDFFWQEWPSCTLKWKIGLFGFWRVTLRGFPVQNGELKNVSRCVFPEIEMKDIFAVRVRDKFLLYAPLHSLIALVNQPAFQEIRTGLQSFMPVSGVARPLVEQLRLEGQSIPTNRRGPLTQPLFLGIIPTRGCNLACRYCDFVVASEHPPVMSLGLARQAVDNYMQLLRDSGHSGAAVHFFGGEPFFAREVVHFIVEYAALRAAEAGMRVHFEAITNGIFNQADCEWIADRFETIVLSLDGPAEIQDFHRPALNGRSTFPIIFRNAKIFSKSGAELIIRVCVTHQTVDRMAEIAEWIGAEFQPGAVCFETLTPSLRSNAAGMLPPSPWKFGLNFVKSAQILETWGIKTMLSTSSPQMINQASFCPVGKDALIVSPDGAVAACYLLREDWKRNGLDLRFGQVTPNGFAIDTQALERIRALSVHTKPLCANCLCRYDCAGGCHVNHDTSVAAGGYDNLCAQTRLVTIANLLTQIKQTSLVDEWLADEMAVKASIMQASDRLPDTEP